MHGRGVSADMRGHTRPKRTHKDGPEVRKWHGAVLQVWVGVGRGVRTFSFTTGMAPKLKSSAKVLWARAYWLLEARLSAVMSTWAHVCMHGAYLGRRPGKAAQTMPCHQPFHPVLQARATVLGLRTGDVRTEQAKPDIVRLNGGCGCSAVSGWLLC